ncbi:MAG: TonB-dependent receptor, partial [Bacteroidota bacterium]
MILVPLFLHAFSSKAQVEGTIFWEGEPVVGANIIIQPIERFAITDASGMFTFSDIPFGKYEISISYVGASSIQQSLVVEESTVQLRFELQSNAQTLSEAVVTAKSQTRIQQEQAIQIESVALKAVSGRVKDLTEVIERLPGINVRGSGSFGDRADVTINGLNGTAVRTYIDGLPLEFVYPSFSINNIPIDNISRVDVYKGVVPIDVGTDALGGGVNIITQQKPYNEIKVSYGYGSFNTHQANATASYQIAQDITLSTNLTYNYSDNDYTMDAFVWDDREVREVKRFHDAYELFFGDITLDIRRKKWADVFRLSANYNNFYKEVQNGGFITRFAFGDVNYDGSASAYSLVYDKALGKRIKLETVSNYNRNNVIFTDTTANIYSWDGSIVQRNTRQRGE